MKTVKEYISEAIVKHNIKNVNNKYCKDTIDMGFNSKILWCTCNLGATKPEEIGDYFAWGETESKKYFLEDNYKYNDTNKVLPQECDAANIHLGKGYSIPSPRDFYELINYTQQELKNIKGINCIEFTSEFNGEKLIMPLGGFNPSIKPIEEETGRYWANTKQNVKGMAKIFYIDDEMCCTDYEDMYCGLNIRPILKK